MDRFLDTDLVIAMAVLVCITGYIAMSVFFLRFPNILHRKKKLAFRPVHISHRGGAGENCENTIAAFKHAISQQTEMLELDCHLTKDGIVVVSHDQHLLRRCGLNANIADLEYKELPQYLPEVGLDFMYDFTLRCGEDRKLPTLREVFVTFPKIPINIDMKVYDEELFMRVHNLIKEFNREELVIWGGRSSKHIQALRKINPDIPVFFSAGRVATLLLLFYTGLLPFVPLYESALEIFMPSTASDEKKMLANASWKIKLLRWLVDMLLIRPSLFKHLERRGIQTYLWVLNDEQDWERAFRLGATGIMTDFPTRLSLYLRQNPQYCNSEEKLLK